MKKRRGHFMPPGLLTSQFAALEEPQAEECAINIDISFPPEMLALKILSKLDES
jgi:gluconate kinase